MPFATLSLLTDTERSLIAMARSGMSLESIAGLMERSEPWVKRKLIDIKERLEAAAEGKPSPTAVTPPVVSPPTAPPGMTRGAEPARKGAAAVTSPAVAAPPIPRPAPRSQAPASPPRPVAPASVAHSAIRYPRRMRNAVLQGVIRDIYTLSIGVWCEVVLKSGLRVRLPLDQPSEIGRKADLIYVDDQFIAVEALP